MLYLEAKRRRRALEENPALHYVYQTGVEMIVNKRDGRESGHGSEEEAFSQSVCLHQCYIDTLSLGWRETQ
jgi:hypothetical protein